MPDRPVPTLTVGVVASLLGVSVRTLHHWDEMGLVCPSERSTAGYRIYSEQDLTRLYRVKVYRELEVPLGVIASLLDEATEDMTTSLQQQHERVKEKILHFEQVASSLERLIRSHQEGLLLSAQEQLDLFGDKWNPQWAHQAQRRWGHTPQWAEFAERSAQRDAQQWQVISEEVEALEQALAEAFTSGVEPESEAAHQLAERHRRSLGEYFSCTHSMHVCLGRMYTEDEYFRAHYDRRAHGLTQWLREIIDANARQHGVDPETAVWG